MKNINPVLVLALACTLLSNASAQEPLQKEDLAGVKLPHGEVVLKDPKRHGQDVETMLDLSDGSLRANPFGPDNPPPESVDKYFIALRNAKIDVYYMSFKGGVLVVPSGRVADLGASYLYEWRGKRLARPGVARDMEEDGQRLVGTKTNLTPGHCYLVETTDGKFALLRLLEQRPAEAVIQFVYQSDGSRTFSIPRGKLAEVTVRRPVPIPPMGPAVDPVTVPGKVTDLKSLRTVRDKMVAELIQVVAANPETIREIEHKAEAIEALGWLRAEEAVEILIEQINVAKTTAPTRALDLRKMNPCVGALIQIGKPASVAAVQAIGKLPAPADDQTARDHKLWLLVYVIRGVEGQEGARFMIEHAAKDAASETHTNYEAALKYLRQ